MAALYNLDDKVNIVGRVTEILQNEEVGVRYTIKIKSNDKTVYLTVEEDEISPIATKTETNNTSSNVSTEDLDGVDDEF